MIVLGVHKMYPDIHTLTRLALWNYVLYRSFNHLRHSTGVPQYTDEIQGIMEQYLREAVHGHEEATRFLDWDGDL